MKTEVIPFKSFMNGSWNQKPEVTPWKEIIAICAAGGSILAVTLPQTAEAAVATMAGSNTFDNLHVSIMNMFDSGVVLVLIFAGACWVMNHRGKALEITIGTAAGYLLARHAVDIRDFLKGI
jgi:hypothetical protein